MICRVCRQPKNRNNFGRYQSPKGKVYRRKICKECRTAREIQKYFKDPSLRKKKRLASKKDHYLKRYGLTLAARDKLIKAQNGKCKICKKKSQLHVDHSHKTGAVRGMLCGKCNKAIGLLHDNISILKSAIRYLT